MTIPENPNDRNQKYHKVKKGWITFIKIIGERIIFVLEFNETPDSAFFQTLRDKGFDYYDSCYRFQRNWGSGLVKDEIIPKGEKGNCDYTMTICEGEKTAAVRVMELWI